MSQLNFDHIHYRSKDFEATRHFYVKIMEAIELQPIELGGNNNLQFVLGGANLLFAPAPKDAPDSVPANTRLGVYHIAFLVGDCDAATEYYRKRGATVAVEPFMADDTIRAAFLQGPDGMWVELKEIVSDEKASK